MAFKAAQLQSEKKAVTYLREIREMVFLHKKNISKWEHLEAAAKNVGLDVQQFKTDYEGKATALFQEDLKLGKQLGVSGFPSLFFTDNNGSTEFVYGTKPYAFYEMAILKLAPSVLKAEYSKKWDALFTEHSTLTAREFTELSGSPRKESEQLLIDLTAKGLLMQTNTKNGSFWKLIKIGTL